ncbi:hypothetical protein HY626_00275 [Candidatus Uhrbacteria bacterium]|nr:hypothetical protein [Candidatus Uhrbacteria bacterium]
MHEGQHPPPEKRNREVWSAHIYDFAQHIFDGLGEDERMEIDRTAGKEAFMEDALSFALKDPKRFKHALIELVRSLALVSGGKNLFDKVHNGGLALDRQGNLVAIKGTELEIDFSEGEASAEMGDQTYEVLTGADAGKTYSTRTHPLWSPGSTDMGEA